MNTRILSHSLRFSTSIRVLHQIKYKYPHVEVTCAVPQFSQARKIHVPRTASHFRVARSLVEPNRNSGWLVLQSRALTVSAPRYDKETSKVELAVKEIENDIKEMPVAGLEPKRSIGKKIMDELIHYYHGFRLLFIDVKISSRLARKKLFGPGLTRREHKQLVRTISDLFRLVPFSLFIIIPFMEFLLPIFLKLFPGMLPSTFQTASAEEAKVKKQLKVKLEMAKFLQVTLNDIAPKAKGEHHSHTAKEFAEFFQKVRGSGEHASNKEILKFSKLFEDEITLDNLSKGQLSALCKLLEIPPIGTTNVMRFQLRQKLRMLKADDKIIKREGVEILSVPELQAACRARGMRALGLSRDRLQGQLMQWLELSLNENIPQSLLLLSRALYLSEDLPTPLQLEKTISAMSDTAGMEAKLKIGEMEGKVDNKTKREIIRMEEEAIKKEEEENMEEAIKTQKEDIKEETIQKMKTDAERLLDPAPTLKESAAMKDLSKEDFDNLETAMENIAVEKHKLIIEKEELEELKDEMDEYKEDVEHLKELTSEKVKETKAAKILSKRVNKMIDEITEIVEKDSTPIKEEDDKISISDLMKSIQVIQKSSDDSRLQRIREVLELLDANHDGSVEVDEILKVIEVLGDENVKVSSSQIGEIHNLIQKEEFLEKLDKIKSSKNLKKV